ncbi:MAG: cell envelope integrity protein TolA [Proteobacteria bacterium]|nr:cell envelope integrity protein TolA [Pseudomonadota bacterium]
MQSSLVISATVHVGLLVVAYFGVPALFVPPPVVTAPIPVELVSIGEITTPKTPQDKAPPKPQPKPEVKVEPEPVKEPPPQQPAPAKVPQPETAVRPDLPSLPPPPLPKETEIAALPPEPLPPKPKKLEPEPKEVAPPKPEAKPVLEPPKPAQKPPAAAQSNAKTEKSAARRPAPRPLTRPQTKAKFDPTRISALLDKTPKKEPPPPPQKDEKKRTVDDIKIKERSQPQSLASAPTISEIDFIRRQLLNCWYLPGGAKDLQKMRVTIRVELSRDGTLARPPTVVDRIGRQETDEAFFRTFEESALRAVRTCTDPKSPLQLPPGDANKWRDLEFTFDPRDMLG